MDFFENLDMRKSFSVLIVTFISFVQAFSLSFAFIERNFLSKKDYTVTAQNSSEKKYTYSFEQILQFIKSYKYILPRNYKAKYILMSACTGDYEYTYEDGSLHLKKGSKDYQLGKKKGETGEDLYYIDENGELILWGGRPASSGYLFIYDIKQKLLYTDYFKL